MASTQRKEVIRCLMVQQAGRKGVFVGHRRWTDGRHFRPLTMFEGIAALAAVPLNLFPPRTSKGTAP